MIWVEVVFMMLVLKIPLVYVCWVVWWAVKDQPAPPEAVPVTVVSGGDPRAGSPWRNPTGGGRREPRGRPARTYSRAPFAAPARASGGDGTVPR